MLKRTKPDYSTSHSARLTEDVLADERDDYDYLMQTSTVWQFSVNISIKDRLKLSNMIGGYYILPVHLYGAEMIGIFLKNCC